MNQKTTKVVKAEKPDFTGDVHGRQREELPAGRYIVTYCQNNTPANTELLTALREYVINHAIGTKILGCKGTYNLKGFQLNETGGASYHPSVIQGVDLLVEHDVVIGGQVVVAGSANILPTAKNPLSGFEAYAPGYDVIIPHAKIALSSLPRLGNEKTRHLVSTGALTLRNYVAKKAGNVANVSHKYAGLLVDVRETGERYFRHLELKNGAVIDAAMRPSAVESIVLGDIHSEKSEPEILQRVHSLLASFENANVFVHDSLDFSSRNHHNIKDIFHLVKNVTETVRGDLEWCGDVLAGLLDSIADDKQLFIVPSNHDSALDKWLTEADWKKDAVNALTYLELAILKIENPDGPLLELALERYRPIDSSVFLRQDESITDVHGIEYGNHGHKGINGARGSALAYSKLSVPCIIGHSHSPAIVGECYQVGVTGSLNMGYNSGPSSWTVAHCVTLKNGARQLLIEDGGRYF